MLDPVATAPGSVTNNLPTDWLVGSRCRLVRILAHYAHYRIDVEVTSARGGDALRVLRIGIDREVRRITGRLRRHLHRKHITIDHRRVAFVTVVERTVG